MNVQSRIKSSFSLKNILWLCETFSGRVVSDLRPLCTPELSLSLFYYSSVLFTLWRWEAPSPLKDTVFIYFGSSPLGVGQESLSSLYLI